MKSAEEKAAKKAKAEQKAEVKAKKVEARAQAAAKSHKKAAPKKKSRGEEEVEVVVVDCGSGFSLTLQTKKAGLCPAFCFSGSRYLLHAKWTWCTGISL